MSTTPQVANLTFPAQNRYALVQKSLTDTEKFLCRVGSGTGERVHLYRMNDQRGKYENVRSYYCHAIEAERRLRGRPIRAELL